MSDPVDTLPVPANTDNDPYATAESSLEWLLMLRAESLKLDVNAMSFERRRQHDEAMAQAEQVIAMLMRKLY